MFALELNNVNYKRKDFSLSDINVQIPKGMITGLVGRNGAGKTTLIHMIANNLARDSGTILYDGIRYWEDEVQIKRKLGIVYDTEQFNDYVKPKKFKKKIAPYIDGFDLDFFEKYMDKFELPDHIPIAKYSTGMKQKFRLILTLAAKPEILIMDEPTSGVDPADRYEMLDMLQEFVQDEGHSVLFSTHITSDLDKIADYLIFIEKGSIVINGEKDSLLESYRLVEVPHNMLNDEIKENLISWRNTTLGITGITRDKKLWNVEGIVTTLPTIEDLAINIREIQKEMTT